MSAGLIGTIELFIGNKLNCGNPFKGISVRSLISCMTWCGLPYGFLFSMHECVHVLQNEHVLHKTLKVNHTSWLENWTYDFFLLYNAGLIMWSNYEVWILSKVILKQVRTETWGCRDSPCNQCIGLDVEWARSLCPEYFQLCIGGGAARLYEKCIKHLLSQGVH